MNAVYPKAIARTLMLAIGLAGSTTAACAQRAVPSSLFGLRPSQSSQQVVNYGDTKSTLLRVLGSPTKTTRFYYEIERVWATVLHYGPNELYLVGGKLESMALHDGRWVIGPLGKPGFRVGSVPTKAALQAGSGVPLAFGSFEVENKPGTSRNLAYHAISAGNFKMPQGGVSDDSYEILFDAQGRVAHVFAD
jgi:hypothetical protein